MRESNRSENKGNRTKGKTMLYMVSLTKETHEYNGWKEVEDVFTIAWDKVEMLAHKNQDLAFGVCDGHGHLLIVSQWNNDKVSTRKSKKCIWG